MKKILSARKAVVFLIVMTTFQLVWFIWGGFEKSDYHLDELFSYGLSNSTKGAFLYDNFNAWVEGKTYHDYLTVQQGDRFSYGDVYHNQTQDVHPPVYYFLMHTICSFFPDTFSKWQGLSLNFVVFVFIQITLYQVSLLLLKTRVKALLACAAWGFSLGAFNNILFIRMYALLTLAIMLMVIVHLKLLKYERFSIKHFIPLLFITVTGGLVHYYFLIFSFFLAIYCCFKLLARKRYSISRYVKYLRYSDYRRYTGSENMIPVSIIVPAYNEDVTIVETVRNLLTLDYPEYEVIVVNDGSRDETLHQLQEAFNLQKIDRPYKKSIQTKDVRGTYCSPYYTNLIVVDKENGGKADALNVGINLSRYPIFVSMDADSILEKQALIRIIMPFLTDNKVIGVGGVVCVSNGCVVKNGEIREIRLPKTVLGKLQTIEYLRSFFMGRIGSAQTNSLLIISGAFGSFKKDVVIKAGGYTTNCIGEDMELVVKLHSLMKKERKKYDIKFLADPICWTQPPESLKDLYKQRKRWQIGLINTLLCHRYMLFNPKYGKIGLLTVPYYWIFEFFGPVFETFGYVIVPLSMALGVINLRFFLIYLIFVFIVGMILSTGALLQESYSMRRFPKLSQVLLLALYALLDNLGYRQFNQVIRVAGSLGYRKNKHSWGSLKRKNFEVS